MHELILGGQKSGKSRAAEARARAWLHGSGHEAALIATALAGDAEMAERIARHRAERIPGLITHEEPLALAAALRRWCAPQRLVVVDCLTLWWTQVALPLQGATPEPASLQAACDDLIAALQGAPGPVVLVSNEIGLGLTPLSPEARRCVDALGSLHQQVARVCSRLTLVVAGCELAIKGAAT